MDPWQAGLTDAESEPSAIVDGVLDSEFHAPSDANLKGTRLSGCYLAERRTEIAD